MAQLKEGEDYVINDDGLFVFTAAYHLRRGFCCESGCMNCPYGFPKKRVEKHQGISEKSNSKPT